MKSKFTAEQMVKIIAECKTSRAVDVARKHGISDKTISNWKKKLGDMNASDAKELKQLECENSHLKRLVARQAYDIECLKEITSKKW